MDRSAGGWLESLTKRAKRVRRSWIFEQLEDRNLFTAAPMTGLEGLSWYSVSNSTAEGQQLVDALAQLWTLESSANNPAGANLAVRATPTDPGFQYQWHLSNVGQIVTPGQFQNLYGVPGEDINVIPAWDSGLSGAGVVVAVVDTGVEMTHPDLAPNIATQWAFNAISGNSNANPQGTTEGAAHGTAVAGLIAAVDNNGIGGTGVAPGATLVPIRLISSGTTPVVPVGTLDPFIRAIGANGAPVDIFNHSWGPEDAGTSPTANRGVDALTMQQLVALTNSARLGRNGLGAIHVFAAGNGALAYDSAGSDGYVNSRYTIAVGVVDHDGTYLNSDGTSTGYGEMAPSVLVVAPSASGPTDIIHNFATGSGIFTTDLTNGGYNVPPLPSGLETDLDPFPDDDYTSRFGGTSAAAPLVSGVIALMLEANPNLTYRDVQEILVRSARQNDELDTSWVVNNTALFRDPLRPIGDNINDGILYEIEPGMEGGEGGEGTEAAAIPDDNDPENDYDFDFTFYNPIFDPRTQPLPDPLWTNGAGYTVSYGRQPDDATEYGYAHGVVDASLAVQLARNWNLRDQNLPPEKTYLVSAVGSVTIRAAAVTNEESGEFLIPGGLSNATEGYIEYFNEFFKEPTVEAGDPMGMPPTEDMIDPQSLPFGGDDPPVNTRGSSVTMNVPAIDVVTGGSNLMSVEWVEVQLNITGDSNAMNYLRITLVSPDGTYSELTQNQFQPDDIDKSFQLGTLPVGLFVGFEDSITPVDENGTNSGELDWVYSTNRSWGERSDSKPLVDAETGAIIGSQGWQLVFENYSGSDLSLNGVSIAFHGAPVGSPAGPVERIRGVVGVDQGDFLTLAQKIVGARDGEFNFDRAPQLYVDPNTANVTQFSEKAAGGVNVYAIDNATGQRVAEFLTGADGNYFFDLPAGEYTIGVEDPLGRTAVGGGSNYDSQWVVEIDTTDGLTRTAGETHREDVDLNGDGEISENEVDVEVVDVEYTNLNFLLDPGSLPPDKVVFTGKVVGDLDADGALDPVDVGVLNFTVYADLNHTGQFEIGEPFALTKEDGTYTLNVSTATLNTFSIGVKAPTGWAATNPASGLQDHFALPGEEVQNVNFMYTPPTAPSGEGPGTIFGLVFSDKNGDGVQQSNEVGLAGRTVFIDTDKDGALDAGEVTAVTNSNGAYQFGGVVLGTVRIDVVVNEPFKLTSPIVNQQTGEGWIEVTLVAGQVVKDINFGVQNLAIRDYGDLVGAGFATDAASSIVAPGVHLGAGVDAEIRPKNLKPQGGGYVEDPNLNGIGDDQNVNESDFDDEDGVVLVGGVLRQGSNLLQVAVAGVGFYLQGWIDFNDNGSFEASERVFNNLDINPGTHQLVINAPTSLIDGDVAARFRWGTINQTASSADTFGEIEDYLFETAVPALGDYNADGNIDQADYSVWKSTYGSTVDLRADGNKNGVIDIGDYTVWRTIKDGAGGAGAGAMAPTLPPQSQLVQPLAGEPSETTTPQRSLAVIGNQSAFAGVGSGVVAQEQEFGGGGSALGGSVVESSVIAAAIRVAGTVPLSNVFTTSIVSTDVAGVAPRATFSGESADLAMLLLATGYFQGHQLSSNDDADSAEAALLGEGERDGDMDLAIAAVFADQRDWRFDL